MHSNLWREISATLFLNAYCQNQYKENLFKRRNLFQMYYYGYEYFFSFKIKFSQGREDAILKMWSEVRMLHY